MNVGSHVHLIDAAIAAADVNVGVLMLMVADEQIVVHQLQVLQAGRVLQGGNSSFKTTFKTANTDSPGRGFTQLFAAMCS